MKAVHKIVAGLAIVGLAASAAVAFRPIPFKVKNASLDGGASGVAAVGGAYVYTTGFEATGGPGGFNTLGYIAHAEPGLFPAGCMGAGLNACWGHTTSVTCGNTGGCTAAPANSCPSGGPQTASLMTPTIEGGGGAHPNGGTQHLRVTHDPATRINTPCLGLGVDARWPKSAFITARPDAPNTVSVEIAISTINGQDFIVQPQSNSMGSSQTIALFFYTGAIYVVDDSCGTTTNDFVATGVFWDTTGGYQNYTVAQNPCQNTAHYEYAGQLLLDSCIWNGTRLDQFLVYGDNYPGSFIDVDDLTMISEDGPCPAFCGDNVTEGTEACDGTDDAACPGRCIASLQPGECTCTPICTEAAPCPVVNGANTFLTSTGYYTYSGGSSFISVDTCGSNFDSLVDIGGISSNDDCNTGPYGGGNDPSAPCWHVFVGFVPGYVAQSCTCAPNPGGPVLITARHYLGGDPAVGSTSIINVRKKATCGGPSVGSCCDTNGPDAGCTENVLEANCVSPDVWTDQGKCPGDCVCIPECAGRVCGDDGCPGGSCGTCDDGNICTDDSCDASGQCVATPNTAPCDDNTVCNGREICSDGQCAPGMPLVCDDGLVCNGLETCDPIGGCRPGTPLNCGDGNACNGIETCAEPNGCVPGTPLVCDDGVFCNGAETCAPPGGCVGGTPPSCDDGVDCTADSCDTATDACVNDDAGCSIPTVSEWGLVVLTLMLLIGAKVYFGRRQAIA